MGVRYVLQAGTRALGNSDEVIVRAANWEYKTIEPIPNPAWSLPELDPDPNWRPEIEDQLQKIQDAHAAASTVQPPFLSLNQAVGLANNPASEPSKSLQGIQPSAIHSGPNVSRPQSTATELLGPALCSGNAYFFTPIAFVTNPQLREAASNLRNAHRSISNSLVDPALQGGAGSRAASPLPRPAANFQSGPGLTSETAPNQELQGNPLAQPSDINDYIRQLQSYTAANHDPGKPNYLQHADKNKPYSAGIAPWFTGIDTVLQPPAAGSASNSFMRSNVPYSSRANSQERPLSAPQFDHSLNRPFVEPEASQQTISRNRQASPLVRLGLTSLANFQTCSTPTTSKTQWSPKPRSSTQSTMIRRPDLGSAQGFEEITGFHPSQNVLFSGIQITRTGSELSQSFNIKVTQNVSSEDSIPSLPISNVSSNPDRVQTLKGIGPGSGKGARGRKRHLPDQDDAQDYLPDPNTTVEALAPLSQGQSLTKNGKVRQPRAQKQSVAAHSTEQQTPPETIQIRPEPRVTLKFTPGSAQHQSWPENSGAGGTISAANSQPPLDIDPNLGERDLAPGSGLQDLFTCEELGGYSIDDLPPLPESAAQVLKGVSLEQLDIILEETGAEMQENMQATLRDETTASQLMSYPQIVNNFDQPTFEPKFVHGTRAIVLDVDEGTASVISYSDNAKQCMDIDKKLPSWVGDFDSPQIEDQPEEGVDFTEWLDFGGKDEMKDSMMTTHEAGELYETFTSG